MNIQGCFERNQIVLVGLIQITNDFSKESRLVTRFQFYITINVLFKYPRWFSKQNSS